MAQGPVTVGMRESDLTGRRADLMMYQRSMIEEVNEDLEDEDNRRSTVGFKSPNIVFSVSLR